jgi:hypothetical protein
MTQWSLCGKYRRKREEHKYHLLINNINENILCSFILLAVAQAFPMYLFPEPFVHRNTAPAQAPAGQQGTIARRRIVKRSMSEGSEDGEEVNQKQYKHSPSTVLKELTLFFLTFHFQQ